MPRRISTRKRNSVSSSPFTSSPVPALPSDSLSLDLVHLRQQWKWAAFSQFFYMFAPLFNMDDVSLNDIEDDLTRGSHLVLPRIMHRLLYTLTQDRKVSLDTWQTSLRKQYSRRDPLANPLGPEPSSDSRAVSLNTVSYSDGASVEPQADMDGIPPESSMQGSPSSTMVGEPKVAADNVTPVTSKDTIRYAMEQPPKEYENEEKPFDWRDLPMLVKLDSMHRLAEWHFQNPSRLRAIMKDDDEGAQWRIEPIGYDSKANAYWLIGEDRLWIQREPPKPRRTLKRKRNGKGSNIPNTVEGHHKTSQRPKKRQRLEPKGSNDGAMVLSSPPAPQSSHTPLSSTVNGVSDKNVRAAKLNANIKLDAHSKALAEYRRQAAAPSSSRISYAKSSPTRPVGIRVSARLRGTVAEEEWQPVPEEWLAGNTPMHAFQNNRKTQNKDLPKTGLESGEDSSDLTDLSEEDNNNGTADNTFHPAERTTRPDDPATPDAAIEPPDLEEPSSIPEGFIEWETLCVTLYDWEHIAERFEKSSHYAEKALYKVLGDGIVPVVTEQLKEIERKRRLEEAVVQRKRSSRIAIKESEKEEARAAARKKAEDEEKLSRARRLEARLQKEEVDREKRETAREQRRREREEREQRQSQQHQEGSIDVIGNVGGPAEQNRVHGACLDSVTAGTVRSGTRTPAGEDWELDCEICHGRGINKDDGLPMMCCGGCFRWQHIPCHDRADLQAGLPKRNWDAVEFLCQRCRSGAESALSHRIQDPPQQIDQNTASQSYSRHLPGIYATSGVYQTSGYGQRHVMSDLPTQKAPSSPVRQYQPHTAITFTHYQPQQHGFSTSRTFQSEHPHSTEMHAQNTSIAQPSQFISHYSNTAANGSADSSSVYPRPPVQPRHDDPQSANISWSDTSRAQPSYGSLNISADHTINVLPYGQPLEDYRRQYVGPPQWQTTPHRVAPNPPLNQQSQFRYHQTMGSTYHPAS